MEASAAAANYPMPPDPAGRFIVTVNGGSSSIKFACFEAGDPPRRTLVGAVERIGLPRTELWASDADGVEVARKTISAASHHDAAEQLIAFLDQHLGRNRIGGIGHRVVHGGVHILDHQLVTSELLAELKRTQPLDLAHLPREIALIEAFRIAFKDVPQVACFDTAFHKEMPRVAQLLPIPRRYREAGVRRFGFHGLSYAYLMRELRRLAPDEARGKVVLAHLGSGASMAAVSDGRPIDTTMAFTPTAGLVMGTRPGDLDPGLLVYMMRVEKLSPQEMDEFISKRCGLLGVSETSYDMRDLLSRRATDERARDAVELFCYQACKWVASLAAAMGGLDTLVFSAGIGEHVPEVRSEICRRLGFIGVELDEPKNLAGDAVISSPISRVKVRVIKTDEEIVIARVLCRIVGPALCEHQSTSSQQG